MSYLNRENNYGETPGSQIYPDSEQQEPEIDPLGRYSTSELFDEIVNRASAVGQGRADQLFDFFASQSDKRSQRWVSTGSRDLSVLERAAEMGGEAGEVLNVAKKLLRAELGMIGNYKPGDTSIEELIAKLEYEMGDVLVTLFNLQNKVPGVNLLRGFRRAFNEKSEQLGFPERV